MRVWRGWYALVPRVGGRIAGVLQRKCEYTTKRDARDEENARRTSSMPQVSRARTTSRRLTAAAVMAEAGVPGPWASAAVSGPPRTLRTAPVGAFASGGSRARCRR